LYVCMYVCMYAYTILLYNILGKQSIRDVCYTIYIYIEIY